MAQKEVYTQIENADPCILIIVPSIFNFVQDCDHSHPNWEFLQKIQDFLSRLELKPLQGDEEASTTLIDSLLNYSVSDIIKF